MQRTLGRVGWSFARNQNRSTRSRLRIRWKKAGYEAEYLHANGLACLALVFEKEGREKRKLDAGRERCVREEYLLFGFLRAQFLKTAVQQKGAVLRPGYSDTRPSWPEYGLLFYLNLSKPARACQITSLQDLLEPYIARAFFSCFLTTEVQGAPSKSLVFLLFQRIFWSTLSFIRLFSATLFLQNFLKTNLSSSFFLSLSLQWYPLEHLHATMGLCS